MISLAQSQKDLAWKHRCLGDSQEHSQIQKLEADIVRIEKIISDEKIRRKAMEDNYQELLFKLQVGEDKAEIDCMVQAMLENRPFLRSNEALLMSSYIEPLKYNTLLGSFLKEKFFKADWNPKIPDYTLNFSLSFLTFEKVLPKFGCRVMFDNKYTRPHSCLLSVHMDDCEYDSFSDGTDMTCNFLCAATTLLYKIRLGSYT